MGDTPFNLHSSRPDDEGPDQGQLSDESGFLDPGTISVLIIEDEIAHFHLMRRAICKDLPRTSVLHRSSAATCIEEIDRIHPDVILVDYRMPDMTGVEFLEAIKRKGCDIPVIMITGQGDESIAVKAMKLGAKDYLVKSPDFFRLLPAVVKQVAHEQQLKLKFRKVARLNEFLLESLPYPAMMIRRNRSVLSANRLSQEMGAQVGEYCWRSYRLGAATSKRFGHGECPFCRAGEAFRLGKAIHAPEMAVNGRIWDTWWIPIDSEVCLNYAIDITERKRAEYEERISSRFLEITHRHADMESLLHASVKELRIATGCCAAAIWVANTESGKPYLVSEGCSPRIPIPAGASCTDFDAVPVPETGDSTATCPCSTEPRSPAHPGSVQPPMPGHPRQAESGQPGLPATFSSSVCIPIRLEEQVLGSVFLGDTKEEMLPPETIAIVESAAMKLASAVQRILSREQLKRSEKALRFLSNRLITAQEEERRRISRELHDSIGSSLCTIQIFIDNILKEQQDSKALEKIAVLTRSTIEETRRIMTDLRPSILDDLGLFAALEWYCRQLKEVHPGIEIMQKLRIEEVEVPEPLKIVIFRIVQESFNNITKYSKARRATLLLEKKNGTIRLTVSDDGIGFTQGAAVPGKYSNKGIGLASMKERVEFSGGVFALRSHEGKGTSVLAFWPVAG
ncbi:MAG: response regulator [Desulfobacterales bacterium]